jgi:hypothetical protein
MRLVQLLAASVEAGTPPTDEAASTAAVFNNIDASAG